MLRWKHAPRETVNGFEVRIERQQLGPGLHRMRGNPDIVARNRFALDA